MKYCLLPVLLLCTFVQSEVRPTATETPSSAAQVPSTTQTLAYHESPPNGPLPPTLDPSQFKDNSVARVAYTIAALIEPVLYQVPCHCPCNKEQGHQSLLDCFTSRHGISCRTCEQEAIFCFTQHSKGKKPADIRKGIADGKAWKVDLARYAKRFESQAWSQTDAK